MYKRKDPWQRMVAVRGPKGWEVTLEGHWAMADWVAIAPQFKRVLHQRVWQMKQGLLTIEGATEEADDERAGSEGDGSDATGNEGNDAGDGEQGGL